MSAGQCDLCISVLVAPDTVVCFAKVNLKRKLARLLPPVLSYRHSGVFCQGQSKEKTGEAVATRT